MTVASPSGPRTPLVALCAALALGGCSTLAHKHIAAHGPHALADRAADAPDESAEGQAPERRRLLVLVVEGLRQSVLTDYLDRLDDADDEPDWRSGLAVLRQSGFRFAMAGQAESSVPGGGLAAAATWATGQWPASHRIPGDVFYEARPDGQLLRYAFDEPLDGARIQYGPGLTWPTTTRPTLPGALLAERTWAARLAPTHRVAFTFAPFGHEAEWLVPEPADVGAATRLPTPYAAAASPLFDRESADGALEMLLQDDVDVVVAWFRGVGVESCVQPTADCGGGGGLNAIQGRALQVIDARLGDVLDRYQIALPDAFARTSVLLLGTGSGIDRGDTTDNAKVMPPGTLIDRVIERASDECVPRLTAARERGDLVVAAGATSVARIYLRPAPLGQRARLRADLACLGPALEALVEGSPWVSAVAHLPVDRLDMAGARAERFVIRMRADFDRGLSARRRNRLRARIRRSIDDGPTQRAGDAVVFAASGWIFADPSEPRLLPDAALGGLTDVSMAMPFLIADRALSDVADGALRSTTVELADVAPTILAMAEAPEKAFAGLPRPPVVRWREGALDYVRADRRIRAPERPERPSILFGEGPDGLTVGLDESTELWPADVVALRIGEAVYRWDPDANAFPAGLPCTYAEAEGRRRWRCTAPVDRRGPGTTLVAAQRDPSGDDAVDGPLVRIEPVVVGESKPFLGDAAVQCVTPGGMRLALTARDPLGLATAQVFVVDDRIGADDRIQGGLSASVELGRLKPGAACTDAFAPDCAIEATATEVGGAVEVPFDRALMQHHAAVMSLPGVAPVDARALRRAWSDAGDPGTAPERAWLAVKVCNVAGQCVRRALVSDVDLAAAPTCP